jgi:hypothetical protein
MSAKNWEVELAYVEGVGEFPFDMLRYDRCSPYRSEDAWAMSEEGRLRGLLVVRYRGQPGAWTPERWRSFLWGIRTFQSESDALAWWRERGEALSSKGGQP